MATVSLTIDTRRPRIDNTYPLVFRIFLPKGKDIRLPLKIYLPERSWDAKKKIVKNHPNKEIYNFSIIEKTAILNRELFSLETSGKLLNIDIPQLKNYLQRAMCGLSPNIEPYFQDHYRKYIESIKKSGTKTIYRLTLNKVDEFSGKQIQFSDIDVNWLKDFEVFLQNKGHKINGINLHFRNIRAVINDAINRKIVVDYDYPFKLFKLKLEPTRKRDLSINDLRIIRDYKDPLFRKYLDIFMLSFYLGGINIGDLCLLKKSDYYNGRIVYRRQKTNGDPISIPVEPEALDIINKYSGAEHLIDILDNHSCYKTFLHRMDHVLKKFGPYEIEKYGKKVWHPLYPFLSSYYARHSFATIASEDLDIPEDIIGRILGHASRSVTGIYIHKKSKKVDEAIRKVINYLNSDITLKTI